MYKLFRFDTVLQIGCLHKEFMGGCSGGAPAPPLKLEKI